MNTEQLGHIYTLHTVGKRALGDSIDCHSISMRNCPLQLSRHSGRLGARRPVSLTLRLAPLAVRHPLVAGSR